MNLMIRLSVLFLAIILLHLVQCRRLNDNEMDNDIGGAFPAIQRQKITKEWVKIIASSKSIIKKQALDALDLECEAMGSPPPTIQWMKDNLLLTVSEPVENNLIDETLSEGLARVKSRLFINHLLPIHQGKFTCIATSGSHVTTAESNLYVMPKDGVDLNLNFTQLLRNKILGAFYVPRVTLWMPTYIDVIGSNVILPCHSMGNPKPSLTWYDPQGVPIGDNDGRITVLPGGDLSIASLNWGDMGAYTCELRNTMGKDAVETFIYPMSRES